MHQWPCVDEHGVRRRPGPAHTGKGLTDVKSVVIAAALSAATLADTLSTSTIVTSTWCVVLEALWLRSRLAASAFA